MHKGKFTFLLCNTLTSNSYASPRASLDSTLIGMEVSKQGSWQLLMLLGEKKDFKSNAVKEPKRNTGLPEKDNIAGMRIVSRSEQVEPVHTLSQKL